MYVYMYKRSPPPFKISKSSSLGRCRRQHSNAQVGQTETKRTVLIRSQRTRRRLGNHIAIIIITVSIRRRQHSQRRTRPRALKRDAKVDICRGIVHGRLQELGAGRIVFARDPVRGPKVVALGRGCG